MSHPWMPFYVGDYLSKTIRLTTEEHGAYMLLIMEYWQQKGLADDDALFARIVRMPVREWKKIRPTIQSFFKDGWRHERIDQELAKADVKHSRRVEAGKRGGDAKSAGKQTASKPPSNATQDEPSNALASSSQPQKITPSLRSGEPPRKRATVIPPDFEPDLGEAQAIGLSLPEAINEAAGFKDYWGGAGKPKANWNLVWRVWCRKTIKDRAKGQRNGNGIGRSSVEVHTAGMAEALAKRRGNREREAVPPGEVSRHSGGIQGNDNRTPLVIEHNPGADGWR